MTSDNNLSQAAKDAQDAARFANGTFGPQQHTEHEPSVREGMAHRDRPSAYVEDGLIVVSTADGRTVEYAGATARRTPVEEIAPAAKILEDGAIEVTWAVNDEDDQEYGWPAGYEFENFRNEAQRDSFIARRREQGVAEANIFIVDKDDSGDTVRYSLAAGNPDHSFTIAPSGVLILDARGDGDVEVSEESAARGLTDFTSHSNGQVYGIMSVILNDDGTAVSGSDEELWNIIGVERAQTFVDGVEREA
jgi:hypothetical protein